MFSGMIAGRASQARTKETRPRARLPTLSTGIKVLDARSAKPAVKTANPFYRASEWRALVAQIILERGAKCEDPSCRFPSRAGIRLFGDHIIELADGGAPLDKANVMLRCGSCHTRKTNVERAKRVKKCALKTDPARFDREGESKSFEPIRARPRRGSCVEIFSARFSRL
jgi:5-methylcytosine-specific restriction protein A